MMGFVMDELLRVLTKYYRAFPLDVHHIGMISSDLQHQYVKKYAPLFSW